MTGKQQLRFLEEQAAIQRTREQEEEKEREALWQRIQEHIKNIETD